MQCKMVVPVWCHACISKIKLKNGTNFFEGRGETVSSWERERKREKVSKNVFNCVYIELRGNWRKFAIPLTESFPRLAIANKRFFIYKKSTCVQLLSEQQSHLNSTRPRFFNFAIWLRLDLGYKALIFASTMNLESGPRFANIWLL